MYKIVPILSLGGDLDVGSSLTFLANKKAWEWG